MDTITGELSYEVQRSVEATLSVHVLSETNKQMSQPTNVT